VRIGLSRKAGLAAVVVVREVIGHRASALVAAIEVAKDPEVTAIVKGVAAGNDQAGPEAIGAVREERATGVARVRRISTLRS
jgi:hypothetical protein